MLFDVVSVEDDGRLGLMYHFLKVLIFASQGVNVSIDGREPVFEVVDLVIEDLVVGVDGNLAVNEGIHGLRNFIEVFVVQVVHLLHECLRRARCHAG